MKYKTHHFAHLCPRETRLHRTAHRRATLRVDSRTRRNAEPLSPALGLVARRPRIPVFHSSGLDSTTKAIFAPKIDLHRTGRNRLHHRTTLDHLLWRDQVVQCFGSADLLRFYIAAYVAT